MPAQPKVEFMMPRGRTLERGVVEDEAVVLGFGLRLDALAVGGGDAVDVLAHRGGADERDAADERVGEQDSASLRRRSRG